MRPESSLTPETKTPEEEPRSKGLAALIIGASCIGVAPILVRFSEVGPSMTAFYRMLLAMPVYAVWVFWDSHQNPDAKRPGSLVPVVVAGFCFAGDLAFWHWSLQFTTVANSTLLTNLAPIFVLIGARLFLHEKAGRGMVLSILLSIAGAGLLVLDSAGLSKKQLMGDFLAATTAIFYAGYIVAVKRSRLRFSTPVVMAGSGITAIPLLFIAGYASSETLIPKTMNGWHVLIGLALISHLMGQGLITYGLAHLPAGFSSTTLLLQPVVAAILAALLLGERLTGMTILGGVIVLFGIFLAQRSLAK